jgi:hypothetical protein
MTQKGAAEEALDAAERTEDAGAVREAQGVGEGDGERAVGQARNSLKEAYRRQQRPPLSAVCDRGGRHRVRAAAARSCEDAADHAAKVHGEHSLRRGRARVHDGIDRPANVATEFTRLCKGTLLPGI